MKIASFPMGIVLLLAVTGCSGYDQPVRQRGIVTLNGQPLAGFTVTLMSTENKRPSSGTTGDDGTFELMTFNPGDGALRGEYKVVINPPLALPGAFRPQVVKNPENKTVPAIHANYTNAQKTPLRRVIPAPEGEIRIELNENGS
jgi:hypothetical protein